MGIFQRIKLPVLIFLQYFPLSFAMMALISLAVSLKIAFKLVTLLAIIPLPAAVYLCLRRLGYVQNTAAIGAVLSLPFLFMTENSMWAGNIHSTLAGEFTFGISFILYVIFTGKLYADISARKSPWGNSVLEALIAMGKKKDPERFFRQALFSWPENDATKQAGLRLTGLLRSCIRQCCESGASAVRGVLSSYGH